jgi:hypothetical protein
MLNMVEDHLVTTSDPYNLQRFVEAQRDDYEDGMRRTARGKQEFALDVVHLSTD